ncbi:vWA domain-containing protein [Micromonospora sp. DT228]|uniref:vWA domain-containing protein n=1 Tax=Micromonospora sp. DT228 TaxID=3393443 RepID=UPI003CED1E73
MRDRRTILPVYIVADESGSLGPHLDEVNQGIASIQDALLDDPIAAAKVRLTIIGFAEDAIVRLHLADLRRVETFPVLLGRGSSNYGPAFSILRELIPSDVATLKGDGYSVHRPAVFFLSDGQPTDGNRWHAIHRSITDRSVAQWAPNIIACGIGDAEPSTMLSVATRPEYGFIVPDGIDAGLAISRFCLALTKSVVASGRSLADGTPQLIVERPEGFKMAIDVV